MTHFVGLDVSQKMTSICVVDNAGRRLWRGQCPSVPEQIGILVHRHAGEDARIGIETGAMTPWSCTNSAHLGLTPRQYQSGEVDRSGRISKCGDTLARTLMYEAAGVVLTRLKRASSLKDWAQAIAKRSGAGKARVALARKLSVILHSIWRSGQPFRWSEHASAT
jgi:hypothetical protein